MTKFSTFSFTSLSIFNKIQKRTLNSNKIVLKFMNQFHDLIITYNISYNRTT